MPRYAVALTILALAISGCGSKQTSPAQKQQINQATTKLQTALKQCLPNKAGAPDVFALRTGAGRTAFVNCAVPPAKRVAFKQCVTNVLLGGLPTKSRLENGIGACLNQA